MPKDDKSVVKSKRTVANAGVRRYSGKSGKYVRICPKCGKILPSKAIDSNSEVTCPKCGEIMTRAQFAAEHED